MNKQSVASVKDRLMNRGKATGKTMQEMLTVYGLERTIYRISVSPYAQHFTLKGGIFLYAVFAGAFARATTDIDLLAQQIGNDINKMKAVFTDILSVETEDPLRFDTESLDIKAITEFKEYHGVNVTVMAYLDRTRIPVSIDIGFGDIVYPGRVKMEFPVILNDRKPEIFAYSLASCVAEKFEAIVSLGYENSRYKDFYDIYSLAIGCDFDGSELREAIKETFAQRHTGFDDIIMFEYGFPEEEIRKRRWDAFVRKKKAMMTVSLRETVELIKLFLGPIVSDIRDGVKSGRKWDHETKRWVENVDPKDTMKQVENRG